MCATNVHSEEIAEIVGDAIEDALTRVPEDSRRAHVLTAIMEAFGRGTLVADKRAELKTLLSADQQRAVDRNDATVLTIG